jgi:hypothetical protein
MSKPTTVKEAIKNFETDKGVTAANEEKVRAAGLEPGSAAW